MEKLPLQMTYFVFLKYEDTTKYLLYPLAGL